MGYKGFLTGLVIASLGFLLLNGCAASNPGQKQPAPTPKTNPLVSPSAPLVLSKASPLKATRQTSPEFLYFMEIALGAEYGMANFSVKKWQGDVKLEIVGSPTAEDLQTVDEVISDLNALVAPNIQLKRVAQNGNVQLHFIPHNQFYQYEPRGIVFYGGFFWGWWKPSGEIYRARIVIGTDRLTQPLRNHYIREEITQILGLMNDSRKYPDSIFYQDYSETSGYSQMDQRVIRLLYNRKIRAGMSDFQLRDIWKEIEKTAHR